MVKTSAKSGRGLFCTNCGSQNLLVVYRRPVGFQRIKRRHECVHCSHRMTAYEYIPTKKSIAGSI